SIVCVEMVTNPARSEVPHAWAESTGEIDFLFLHDGLPVGRVRHRVSVDVGGDETSTADPGSWLGAEAPPCSMSIASTLPEPDLTIIITASAEVGTGRFVACLRSRHLEAGSVTAGIDLGSDAAAFAEVIMKTIPSQDGEVFIDETIAGISKVIARTVDDPQFWTSVSACLSAAQAQRGEAPSVLLLTSESFVPWELADIGATPVAPDAPPLLAAQARVGRWILDDVHCTPMADQLTVDIDRIATVVGEYQPTSGLARLPLAEEEGQYLRDQLGATYVSATADEVDIVLGARLRDPFQILHFACHGNVTPLGMNALYMNNGKELLHFAIEASAAGREYRPLVFLNACRVGAGQSQLNQYGGFAGSFLRAGYSGFIGPLWAVDDTVAHEVATDFYSGLATENRPAEILRTIRTRFVATDEVQAPPSTYLAYVYYGHPDLALNGVRSTSGAQQ
ncbi:MAG: CHAT domain-containing protein, partial [Acidimicrobiales bacterium]|nr:CHAT domain-containing protein [Acidimicrobiales bacterium]